MEVAVVAVRVVHLVLDDVVDVVLVEYLDVSALRSVDVVEQVRLLAEALVSRRRVVLLIALPRRSDELRGRFDGGVRSVLARGVRLALLRAAGLGRDLGRQLRARLNNFGVRRALGCGPVLLLLDLHPLLDGLLLSARARVPVWLSARILVPAAAFSGRTSALFPASS